MSSLLICEDATAQSWLDAGVRSLFVVAIRHLPSIFFPVAARPFERETPIARAVWDTKLFMESRHLAISCPEIGGIVGDRGSHIHFWRYCAG